MAAEKIQELPAKCAHRKPSLLRLESLLFFMGQTLVLFPFILIAVVWQQCEHFSGESGGSARTAYNGVEAQKCRNQWSA